MPGLVALGVQKEDPHWRMAVEGTENRLTHSAARSCVILKTEQEFWRLRQQQVPRNAGPAGRREGAMRKCSSLGPGSELKHALRKCFQRTVKPSSEE